MGDEIMGPNNSTSSTNEDIYKARGKRRKLLISELVLDYSNNTTLHGIPYATKRVLTMVEKFLFMGFWMITTIISMILCSIVIYQLWERWRTSPVIVTINEHMVSVATVPLPSIIICPQKKINTNKYNYTHEYNELSQFKDETLLNSSTIERINKFNDINQVCGDYRKELPIRSRDYTDGSIVDHILDVSLDVDNVFMYCLSINKSDLKCKGLFAKVITPEGVCFTMNTLAHEEIFRSKSILHPSKRLNTEKRSKGWSMAQGYTDSTSDSYPIRGTEDSGVPDLSFFLYNVESDNEYRCNYITSGYRIYLSHPTDMPQSSKYYYPIDNSKHTALALSFNVLNTSESLRTYSVEDRQCYFPKDRYLRYFNIYTANNCWIECLANYTYQYCNCTAYDMPHNGSGQICAEVKLLCVRQIREKLVLYKDARSLGCNCLPACVSVDYEADILKTELNFDSSTLGDESFKTIKYTRLDVFYKKPRYLSMRRSELFAMTEFLADCGGVLGLFLGFSFLSIVELLYYFTLRLMCILKKDLEEEKAKVVKTVQNERDEVAVQNIATNIYGDVCLRKQRRRRQKKLLTELFFDYSNNTTLHGIPYITKRGLTIIEKIFWILTTVSSIIWCSVLIYQLWARWKASPVIVTISEHMVPVSMVPFPSITICPQSKSYVSKYNYSYESSKKWPKHDSENYSISDYQRFYKLEDVKQICGNIFESINIFRNFTNSSLLDHILEVSPDIDDVLLECKWRDNTTNCGDIFSKVLTGEGVCFTTNSLSYEEIFTKEVANAARHLEATNRSNGWSLDRGYFSSKLDHYPRRGIENPVKPDLEVILQENTTETDSSCNSHNSGFRVYVHHPASLPQSSLYYYAVINNQRSSVALSFNILNTSEALRSYDAIKRQCYFTHEKILRYFKDYTEKNCWIECLSNYTYFKCQCVSFYLPHNNSNEICAEGKLDCVTGAQEELVMKEMYSPTCNCLPACVSVDYDAEILKTDFNIRKQFDYVHRLLNFEFIESTGINYSQLQVFYKKPRFLTMRRSELFGIAEFIANCGGLLGLFMGFSFLSLMELVFYFTLRMTCILKKDLEEEKTQAKARLE